MTSYTTSLTSKTQAETDIVYFSTMLTAISPPSNENTFLIIIITTVCSAIVSVLFVICVITIIVFVRLLRKKSPDLAQNLYAEVGSTPIYETVDKDLSCNGAHVSKSDTDLYINMCGVIAPDTVRDTAEPAATKSEKQSSAIWLEVKEGIPIIDRTLEEDTNSNLTKGSFHYQNISEALNICTTVI